MHHARVKSMTSEDQDHDRDYSDESSNEASQEASSPKRRRLSQSWVNVSCQLCKTRKVKCDRTLPSCGWCTRNNAACEYKERKKPGLRAGYGRELEQRLDKLEGILLQHTEVLARVLADSQNSGRRWTIGNETANTQAQEDVLPSRQDRRSNHLRRDSSGIPYSMGEHHGELPHSLPPIKTAPTAHDRRPSVSFMNNPISSPPFYVKPSQSPPAFCRGVLKPHAVSPPYAPLLTPNTTTSSGSHSPQHAEDYVASQRPTISLPTTAEADALRRQYPFSPSLSNYTIDPLPPWPVMYELAVLYFNNINSVLPLLSESAVFSAIVDPSTLHSSSANVRAILMAITATAMRFLSTERLEDGEKEYYVRKCREELARPGMANTKEGTKALAVLLLGNSGELGKQETQDILAHVNDRLWQHEKDGKSKPQSPLSVSEMLCPS